MKHDLSSPSGYWPEGFAPRSLLHRRTINVALRPSELHRLIKLLEIDAMRALACQCPAAEAGADALLERVAQLREAGR